MNLKHLLIAALATCTFSVSAQSLNIYSDFPGGNIIIDKIMSDTVYLRPDLRDTEGNWFYWYYAVSGAKDRTITFKFTRANQFSTLGASISTDGGASWSWQGANSTKTNQFIYHFTDNNEVRFSVGIPYTESNFKTFIGKIGKNPYTELISLCYTAKDRTAEMLKIRNTKKTSVAKVLVVARNHACEMMGNYVMEGIISGVLASKYLSDNIEFLFVPFIDKDGVEDGDQGKNRLPRDHNRDYSEISVHSTTTALRSYVPVWSEGKLKMAFDLHCPWVTDANAFFIGQPDSIIQSHQLNYITMLERNITGEIPFKSKSFLRPGEAAWYSPLVPSKGANFSTWASSLSGIDFGMTLEFPYSQTSGVAVTADNARRFGLEMAKAMELYLKSTIK